ncbi:MAG: DNA-deoxyinosine glycosylase [Clostridia bacterium]|nr:DNA-deoxyinosine glycosylase [Clostridia bacterium]
MINHPIPPVYNNESKILILGSFPSVTSREADFFYGHKQNRFWRVLAAVFDTEIPENTEEKKIFLIKHGIALWDVIGACDITGSSDSSIKNVIPNDISIILDNADIQSIYVNGKTALKYYNKYIRDEINRDAICLPSTSPANAAWSLERLVDEWKIIL